MDLVRGWDKLERKKTPTLFLYGAGSAIFNLSQWNPGKHVNGILSGLLLQPNNKECIPMKKKKKSKHIPVKWTHTPSLSLNWPLLTHQAQASAHDRRLQSTPRCRWRVGGGRQKISMHLFHNGPCPGLTRLRRLSQRRTRSAKKKKKKSPSGPTILHVGRKKGKKKKDPGVVMAAELRQECTLPYKSERQTREKRDGEM